MIGEASESDKVARVMRMRPRLRADVDLVELGNGRMLAVSGTRFLALETTHMRVLASLLDGEHRMTEIWRSTNGVMTPALVVRTVMMLEAVGLSPMVLPCPSARRVRSWIPSAWTLPSVGLWS